MGHGLHHLLDLFLALSRYAIYAYLEYLYMENSVLKTILFGVAWAKSEEILKSYLQSSSALD